MCDMHTYREKISLGFTTLSRAQVDRKLAQLEDEWMGDSYDMVGARVPWLPLVAFVPGCLRDAAALTTVCGGCSQLDHNCCHFCNRLCHELGVGELPKWVNRAAGAGSAIAGGIESLVSLKQNFRRSKAVTASGAGTSEPEPEGGVSGGGM